MILGVFLCVFLLAARVPIEETVETKKVEMREEIPSKGNTDLGESSCCSSAPSSAKQCKLICPSSTTKIFNCFVLFHFVSPVFFVLFPLLFNPLLIFLND